MKTLLLLLNLMIISKLSFSQSVTIDPLNANATIVDIKSSSKGFKVSQLTCQQIVDIANPSEGILVYNLDSHLFAFYNGTSWKNLDGSNLAQLTNVGSPPAGTNTSNITGSYATLNWSTVSNAISYNVRYRIVGTTTWNNSTIATNSFLLTGLSQNQNYEWQVQTVSPCGTSTFTNSINFATPLMTASVYVDFAFTPATVTIGVGGQVTWSGVFSTHPVRSGTNANPTNLFYIGVGASYTHTFTQAGTYSYYCVVHGNTGTIIVQ
jgi:plastocyanin